jgi:hypothetical protein
MVEKTTQCMARKQEGRKGPKPHGPLKGHIPNDLRTSHNALLPNISLPPNNATLGTNPLTHGPFHNIQHPYDSNHLLPNYEDRHPSLPSQISLHCTFTWCKTSEALQKGTIPNTGVDKHLLI